MDKEFILDKTIEITKEFARGGSDNQFVEEVLRNVYTELKKLSEDVDK